MDVLHAWMVARRSLMLDQRSGRHLDCFREAIRLVADLGPIDLFVQTQISSKTGYAWTASVALAQGLLHLFYRHNFHVFELLPSQLRSFLFCKESAQRVSFVDDLLGFPFEDVSHAKDDS